MLKKLLLLTVIAALFVPAVSAQDFKAGPQLGYQKASDADDPNIMFGAALRMKLLMGFGAEAAVHYRQQDYYDGDLTVRSYPITVTGMFYPISLVYGLVGFGWYNTTFDYSGDLENQGAEDDTQQEVGWHFGAGVELGFPNLTLTGDIRYVFLNYEWNDIPGQSEQDSDFYSINVGILFGI